MKILTERTEIAKAMNFGKYPVLSIDLVNKIVLGGKVVGYRGCKVNVPWEYQGKKYKCACQLDYWLDSDELSITSGGCCLHSSFGYSDIVEMVENANLPTLDKKQEFVLVIYNSEKRISYNPMILETDDYKNIHCQSVLSIKEKIKIGA